MAWWLGMFTAPPEVQVQVLASTSGSSSLQLQEGSTLSLSPHTHIQMNLLKIGKQFSLMIYLVTA